MELLLRLTRHFVREVPRILGRLAGTCVSQPQLVAPPLTRSCSSKVASCRRAPASWAGWRACAPVPCSPDDCITKPLLPPFHTIQLTQEGPRILGRLAGAMSGEDLRQCLEYIRWVGCCSAVEPFATRVMHPQCSRALL